MNRIVLIAAIAAAGLTAGATQAASTHTGAYAEPSQPIAYSNLNTYLKASPKQRAARDWGAGAATGASVNTTATTATANAPQTTDPNAADTPTAVNPAMPAPAAQPAAPTAPDAAQQPAQTPVTAPPMAQ